MSNKTKTVSFRLSEEDYKEISDRIPKNEKGKADMKFSEFIRDAILKSRVVAVDKELEQYKVFTAAKIGNNINQIARRLNSDNLAGKINPDTYNEVIESLERIYGELMLLLDPVR